MRDLRPITLCEMVAEAQQEIRRRRSQYPDEIRDRQMSPADAARRLAVMEEIARYLRRETEEG